MAYYRVKKAILQPKEGHQSPTPAQLREILRIDEEQIEGMSKFDEQSEDLLQELPRPSTQSVGSETIQLTPTPARNVSFGRRGNWFSVSVESETPGEEAIGDEVTRCFETLNRTLLSYSTNTGCRS